MTAGRPTDYSEALLKKAREYLSNRPEDEVVPSIEGLADYIGVTRTTIYDWESQEEKAEFSYIVEQVRHKQAKELINKGLEGKFNPTMSKVILTKHGYTDKSELDVTTKGDKVKSDIDLDTFATKLAEQLREEMT